MTEKYASGRFCSEKCARGFSNYKGRDIEFNNLIDSYEYECPYCGKKLKNSKSLKGHIGASHINEEREKQLNDNVVTSLGVMLNITNKELNDYKRNHKQCEICGKTIEMIQNENNHFRNLCIDHNHTTNEFRGLLCITCNSALGWFEKNEENILKYLQDKGKQYGDII